LDIFVYSCIQVNTKYEPIIIFISHCDKCRISQCCKAIIYEVGELLNSVSSYYYLLYYKCIPHEKEGVLYTFYIFQQQTLHFILLYNYYCFKSTTQYLMKYIRVNMKSHDNNNVKHRDKIVKYCPSQI